MTHKPKASREGRHGRRMQPGDGPRIRVRSKRLEQIDETKLALAFYLIAKQLVEDRTDDASDDESGEMESASVEAGGTT